MHLDALENVHGALLSGVKPPQLLVYGIHLLQVLFHLLKAEHMSQGLQSQKGEQSLRVTLALLWHVREPQATIRGYKH